MYEHVPVERFGPSLDWVKMTITSYIMVDLSANLCEVMPVLEVRSVYPGCCTVLFGNGGPFQSWKQQYASYY